MIKAWLNTLFYFRKRLVLSLLLSIVILGSFYWGIWLFFPLQMSEFSNRYEMWKEGVVSGRLGGLHVLVQGQGGCSSSLSPDPISSKCVCVALLHGLGDSALTWKKILLWPELDWERRGLRQPMKLVAVDLPGSGQSPPSENLTDYRARKQAEKLNQVLGDLCPQWIIVGNSFGGWVATWMALDWPERVSRLLLLSPAGMKKGGEIKLSLLTDPTEESMKEFQKKAYFRPRVIPERLWKNIVLSAKLSHAKEIAEAQTEEDNLDLRLPTLQQQTLFVWGQEDHIIPLTVGQQMRTLLPVTKTLWREVPQCGHLPQKECPLIVIQSLIDLINFGAT